MLIQGLLANSDHRQVGCCNGGIVIFEQRYNRHEESQDYRQPQIDLLPGNQRRLFIGNQKGFGRRLGGSRISIGNRDPPFLDRDHSRFGARLHAQFLKNFAQLYFNRINADHQFAGNLLVTGAGSHQPQYFPFTIAQL